MPSGARDALRRPGIRRDGPGHSASGTGRFSANQTIVDARTSGCSACGSSPQPSSSTIRPSGRFSKAEIPSPCVTRTLCLPRTSSVGTGGGAVPAAGSPEISTSPRVLSGEADAFAQASRMERVPDATTIQGESPEFVEGCGPPIESRTSNRSASASTTRFQAPWGRSSSTVI